MAQNRDELIRIEAPRAAEVCRLFAPSPEAVALLADDTSPAAYLGALGAAGHFADAEAFLAFALPRREAVWWGCQCVRQAIGTDPPRPLTEALMAAEAWAAAPDDDNRRKALPAAEAAGYGHPAGCVALAAFLSGGSLAPPGMTEVPPADDLTARMVAGAVGMAVVLAKPEDAPEKHRRFLELGLDVARGASRWKDRP